MMKAAVICVFLFVTAVAGQQLSWWMQAGRYEYGYGHPQTTTRGGYTWHEAQDICMAGGGDLVSFANKAEEYEVSSRLHLIKTFFPYWTGWNRFDRIDRWEWTDRSYRDYAKDFFPSLGKKDRNKKCAVLNWVQEAWSAENCGIRQLNVSPYKIGILCKRRRGDSTPKFQPPKNVTGHCPSSWTDAGTNSSRCYKYFGLNSEVTWKFAEGSCLSLPNHEPNLACANTQEEVDTLTSMALAWRQQDRTELNPGIERERAWFGLRRDSLKDSWIWADNSRINRRNFHDFISMKSDYGNGFIDASATPPGSWDVSTEEDGVRATAASYVCQAEKIKDWY